MSDFILIVIIALIEAGVLIGAILFLQKRSGKGAGGASGKLEVILEERKSIVDKFKALYSEMIDIPSLRVKLKELRTMDDALKAERGRITITQAELETVESRLRELEEIERELEASGLETKEEINILQKKKADLAQKNAALKGQLNESAAKIDTLLSELSLSADLQAQVVSMKTELSQSDQKIDEMMLEIEKSNEQYFILKKRYDALDIEYAQLYEKFTETEAAQQAKSE